MVPALLTSSPADRTYRDLPFSWGKGLDTRMPMSTPVNGQSPPSMWPCCWPFSPRPVGPAPTLRAPAVFQAPPSKRSVDPWVVPPPPHSSPVGRTRRSPVLQMRKLKPGRAGDTRPVRGGAEAAGSELAPTLPIAPTLPTAPTVPTVPTARGVRAHGSWCSEL